MSPSSSGVARVQRFRVAPDKPWVVLEAADSGAAPVFMAAYNHFAVEFLLLLLERVFHLLPFQSSIPGEKVMSERLQAGPIFVWDCSGQARIPVSAAPVPHAARAHCSPPVPKGHRFLTWLYLELPPWPCTVL